MKYVGRCVIMAYFLFANGDFFFEKYRGDTNLIAIAVGSGEGMASIMIYCC